MGREVKGRSTILLVDGTLGEGIQWSTMIIAMIDRPFPFGVTRKPD